MRYWERGKGGEEETVRSSKWEVDRWLGKGVRIRVRAKVKD